LYALLVNPCAIVGGECRQLSLYDSPLGLILTNLVLTLPLAVWFLSSYYRQLPADLEDAAYVDGATPLQAFAWIVLPVSLPGVTGVGLLTFITAWNEFLFARTLSRPGGMLTITTLIASFGFDGFGAVLTLAASVFVMIPVVLLVMVFQRQLTTGLVGYEASDRTFRQRGGWWERLAAPRVGGAATVLLIVLGLGVLVWAQYGWRAIGFPYPLDYGEGPLLDQALRLAHGENIYRSASGAPPWTIANYPPLYMLLQAPLTRIFGAAYWYGRLISWLSTIAAALFVGLIVRTLTGDRLAALVSGLVLLVIPYVSFWSALARIDALALALSLSGLYLVVRWPERHLVIAGGALLLTAAVYTRQSYGLAAPLAAFVWLLWERPRAAWTLAAGIGGLSAILFALLQWLTQGGFWFNIVTANLNDYQWPLLRQYLLELIDLLPALVIGGAAFVLLAGWFRLRSWRVIAPYWIGAAVSALTIGKIGSNVNYLLELSAALSLAIGALLAWLRPRPLLQQGAMLVLALQIFVLVPGSRYHAFTTATLDDPETLDQLMRVVQQTNGPVLADEAMGLLPLTGRRIDMQPFEMTQLARAGVWDQTPLLEAIAQHRYAAILIFRVPGIRLERERWTDEMLQQIERSYEPGDEIGLTTVYTPRGP
ncbi:MAG TPA: ABC transporter permease subunit, partial [Herpetosiphonaceae bacterium]